jgi:hypothetical protein
VIGGFNIGFCTGGAETAAVIDSHGGITGLKRGKVQRRIVFRRIILGSGQVEGAKLRDYGLQSQGAYPAFDALPAKMISSPIP